MKHIDMETFAMVRFLHRLTEQWRMITKNVQDPNTDATATRKITVTITFKPNEQRNFVATGVQTKATLAPALGAVTAITMGKNIQTGDVEAVEIGNQIPGQMSMQDVEEAETQEPPKMVQTVDPSTGEIYETPADNVIDLRARQA